MECNNFVVVFNGVEITKTYGRLYANIVACETSVGGLVDIIDLHTGEVMASWAKGVQTYLCPDWSDEVIREMRA